MRGIKVLLKRFGGASLIESLPGIHDFNMRLQKDAELSTDLNERLAAIELDLANQGRLRKLPPRKENDNKHD